MIKIGKTIAVFFGVLLLMGSALAISYNVDANSKVPREPSTGDYGKYDYKNVYAYTGLMNLGDIELKFQSTSNSQNEDLQFEIYGTNNERGILILQQIKGSTNYEGYLKFIDSNVDTLFGEVKATLVRQDSQLSGKIVAKLQSTSGEEETLEGKIILYEEKSYYDPDYNADKEEYPNSLKVEAKSEAYGIIDSDVKNEDNTKSSSNDPNLEEKKGIWQKFFGLFVRDKKTENKETLKVDSKAYDSIDYSKEYQK